MCCGSNRTPYRATTVHPPPRLATTIAGPQTIAPRSAKVTFEYTGRTGLTVTGAVTGQVYRFDRPGVRIGVDPRDRASMAAVPVLKQV
jgi:hypothetical protein